MEDHVHLLIGVHPTSSVSTAIQQVKSNSSNWINNRSKIGARFEWQRGYGAFSVSHSMAETVKRYIDRQAEHHQRRSFEEEYLAMLRKHRVVFDERYVFDDEVEA